MPESPNLDAIFQQYGYRAQVTGEASFFAIHFTDKEILDYRDVLAADDKEEKTKLFFHLLNNGIFLAGSLRGNLSTEIGEPEVDRLLNVMEDYLKNR